MENLRICILIKYGCYDKLVNKSNSLSRKNILVRVSYRDIVSSKLWYRLRGGL